MNAVLSPNSYVLDITPYKGGDVAETPDTIKLSSNENPYGASPAALAAYRAASDQLFLYPDGSARALRTAIANMCNLDVNRVVCGAGSDELIALLCSAYLSPGDSIVQSRYGFLMYAISAKRCGARTIYAEEKNLRADIDALVDAVEDSTKLLFLANPNNPTGSVLSKQEIITLRERLPERVMLVIDDAYAEYIDDPAYSGCEELTDIYPNITVLRTFSKIYGLAALRVGRSYSSADIADALNRTRGPFNVAAPALAAAEAAICDTAYTEKMCIRNAVQRDVLEQTLDKAGITRYPSAGNFVMTDLGSADNADALDKFLRKNGVIVRNVASYGLPSCLRISVGTDNENAKVCDALLRFSA